MEDLPNEVLEMIIGQNVCTYQVLSKINRRFYQIAQPLTNTVRAQGRAGIHFIDYRRIHKEDPCERASSDDEDIDYLQSYYDEDYDEKEFINIIKEEIPNIRHGDIIVTIKKDGKDDGLFISYIEDDGTYTIVPTYNGTPDGFADNPEKYHPRYWDQVRGDINIPIRFTQEILDTATKSLFLDKLYVYYRYTTSFNKIPYIIYTLNKPKNIDTDEIYQGTISNPYIIDVPFLTKLLKEMCRAEGNENVIYAQQYHDKDFW